MPSTYLFVPATASRRIERALQTSDAVIADLEDAVPDDQKRVARRDLQLLLERVSRSDDVELWVRINGSDPHFSDDLASLNWSTLAGAVLPKAERADRVRAVIDAGARRIMLLLESATGFAALPALAAVGAEVERFIIGTWDLALDLGLLAIDDPDDSELIWQLRGQLVVDSRRLNRRAPIDGIFANLNDAEGLAAACTRAYRLGFAGKLVIHPRQVPVVREAFGIPAGAVSRAVSIIDQYEQAAADGRGAIQVDGQLVDRVMIERARALLRATGRGPAEGS